MPEEIVTAGCILALGALIQTAAGFGIGILSVPLLLASGWDLPQIIPVIVAVGFVQAATGLVKLRREIDWPLARRVAAGQWVGIAGGVVVMAVYLTGHHQQTRQVAGVMVLVLLTISTLAKPKAREQIPGIWSYIAGGLCGFLAGMVAMGGPPLVLFALAHTWCKDRYRAFLWTQFLLGAPVLLGILIWQVGFQAVHYFLLGVALIPAVWLGMWLGFMISSRWDRKDLNFAAILLLYCVGISSVLAPLLHF